MGAYTFQLVRIRFNLASHDPASDQVLSQQPVIWRGNDVMFEFAAAFGDVLIDISSITSVVMEVKPKPVITGTAIFSKAMTTGFTPGLTEAQWTDGSGRHFAVPVTATESGLFTLTDGLKQDFWLVVRALCSSTTTVFTLGTANLTVMEDGH